MLAAEGGAQPAATQLDQRGNEPGRREFTPGRSGLDMAEFAPPGDLRLTREKTWSKPKSRDRGALPVPRAPGAERASHLVTLITGAAAGIGRELARVFAANGHRLALVDRRGDRLAALGREIAAAGGMAPILIGCDLERRDAGDRISEALAAAGVEVEFVVNNAGFGLFGEACELDRAEQLGIIAVNIHALTDLSLRFSDSLIRHRGGILNLGSLTGFLPGPGMAVYHASKAYVLSFSEALHRELAPRGVRVTTLCPGSVPSEFQARAGIKPGLAHEILNLSAAEVAQAGYRALIAGKRTVLPGFGTSIIPFLLRLFPRGFVLAAIGRIHLRKRRDGSTASQVVDAAVPPQ
jgi:short-subunit dehydrogenase